RDHDEITGIVGRFWFRLALHWPSVFRSDITGSSLAGSQVQNPLAIGSLETSPRFDQTKALAWRGGGPCGQIGPRRPNRSADQIETHRREYVVGPDARHLRRFGCG